MLKIKRLAAIVWKVKRGLDKWIVHVVFPLLASKTDKTYKLERLGSQYGGWVIPVDLLYNRSICYCVGVGCDATFDFALIDRFECRVYSFDPTPKSISYMNNQKYDHSKLTFVPIGIWNKNTKMKFYAPANPNHTSHSIYDLQGIGDGFEAECKTISTIMQEYGHPRIDLLKLDIEGAWRLVIEDIIKNKIDISVICVEMDSPVTLTKVLSAINLFKLANYELVYREKDNYLFVRNDAKII